MIAIIVQLLQQGLNKLTLKNQLRNHINFMEVILRIIMLIFLKRQLKNTQMKKNNCFFNNINYLYNNNNNKNNKCKQINNNKIYKYNNKINSNKYNKYYLLDFI